eukprot:COSAG04_NODE_11857_length_684_cov_1.015385_1_plen_94_part_10
MPVVWHALIGVERRLESAAHEIEKKNRRDHEESTKRSTDQLLRQAGGDIESIPGRTLVCTCLASSAAAPPPAANPPSPPSSAAHPPSSASTLSP